MAWRCLTKQVATRLSDFGQLKNSLARSFTTRILVPGHFNIRNTSYNQRCLNFWKSAKHDKDAKDFNDLTRKQVTTEAALLGTISDPIHMVQGVPLKYTLSGYFCNFFRLLIITFLILFGFQDTMMKTGMIKAMGFKIKPIMESDTKFSDVKGVDEAKAELEEIVHYLRNPKKFTRLGGKLPKGVLLVGAPGNGKTMLARAVAGEAGVPFFYCSGSEFDEVYVGVGVKRVRELFAAARKYAPCIVFIDEIDSVGGKRKPHSENFTRMTLNQLLVELDGFKQNEGVVLIGATNYPKLLDNALTRPGRFDRQVIVHYPDVEGRRQIIESYLSKVVKGSDINTRILARGTPGFSGAELSNMVNIAAVKAAMDGAKAVSMNDLEYAKDKISMGSERKSAVISKESRLNTAFHEGGHALVAMYTDGAYPVHKATIVPRGTALGMITQLPDKDRTKNNITRKQMLARLDVLMGGRAAEEFIFGENEVTSGASSDLENATTLAKRMVTQYGMNNEVGNVTHNYIYGGRNMSSETKLLIEKEVKQYLEKAYCNAKAILTSHNDELHALADALMEHETLTGSEIKALLAQVKSKKQQQKPHKIAAENRSQPNPTAPAAAVAGIS